MFCVGYVQPLVFHIELAVSKKAHKYITLSFVWYSDKTVKYKEMSIGADAGPLLCTAAIMTDDANVRLLVELSTFS